MRIERLNPYLFLLIGIIQLKLKFANGKNCQPLIPNRGVDLICKHSDVTRDCSLYALPSTIVKYQCSKFYRPLRVVVGTRQLRCEENGDWSDLKAFQDYLCDIDCGKPVSPHRPFLSYGENTTRDSWPWHAAIFAEHWRTKHMTHICGGSLISGRMILTAAHCLISKYALNSYRIALGAISSNWTDNQNDKLVQIFKVKEIHTHDNYDSTHLRSDIGLLELDRPVSLSDVVSPVCFPYDDQDKPKRPEVLGEGEVVGYGKDETGEYQLHLKYSKLPVVSTAECSHQLGEPPGIEQFCAGVINGSSVCHGDSGSGMIFKNPGAITKYYVQGIVSNGYPGAECRGLSYFTNVLLFTPWVATIVHKAESSVVTSTTSPVTTDSNVEYLHCRPGPCGPNEECFVVNNDEKCRCKNKENTSQGCSKNTFDLDPCNPNPCGVNTRCTPDSGFRPICTCEPSYIGNPLKGCERECETNHGCSTGFACVDFKCKRPCTLSCGLHATCDVFDQISYCRCADGYLGIPFIRCVRVN